MSDIRTGSFLKDISAHFKTRNSIIITDRNVDGIYGGYFKGFKKIVLPPGEKNKNLENIEYIYRRFLEFNVDRDHLVIGIGGGVVCDMTGFAASTYLRGIDFGFFPTTLLAQVDASIGGKNGVDLDLYKNIVGTFNFPSFIYSDQSFLKSLPREELLNGVAEVLKYGFIRSREFLDVLVENREKILNIDEQFIRKVVELSVRIKTDIVNLDKTEKSERRNLNFGHTFGHAFEKILGIPHGQAVAAGIVMSGRFSEVQRNITNEECGEVEEIISGFGFPAKLKVSPELVFEAIEKDKKRSGKEIYFVFLEKLGSSFVKRVDLGKIREFVYAVY